MKRTSELLWVATLGLGLANNAGMAQTAGTARLDATILDYTGSSSTKHWTVVWVTTQSGAFIKSLRKQGPSWTTTHWDSHCSVWNTARGGSASGSQALDGYSSATAADYTGTNSPVICTWNCRDANNNLVADGNYKLWVQYAEDAGQGPYTTSGLLWTKSPAGATNTYPNQGANFANLKVSWVPSAPPAVAPTITSLAPTAPGIVAVPYVFACTATGTAPITFTASGLPTGLTISPTGAISGTPTTKGTFNGTITASNGTLPNATQNFSIVINLVPARLAAIQLDGTSLVMGGSGPANGTYAVLVSTDAGTSATQWTPIATNTFDASGNCWFTNVMDLMSPRSFYRLRLP